MNKELITARMPVQNCPALVTVLYEDGIPAEVFVEPEKGESSVGRIVLGRVESVLSGLDAAFVRTGEDQRVYMPLGDRAGKLKTGEELAVQIVQEPQKTKLAKASPDWEIAGRYMVVSSVPGKPACSRKLTAEQKRELKHLSSEWDTADCGILFRTQAGGASEEDLQREFLQLSGTVREIRRKAAARTCYSVLYEAPGIHQRILSRCRAGELQRFLTDDAALYDAFAGIFAQEGCEVQLYRDPQLELYRLRSLSSLLDRLLSRVVHLRSGGSLIIEQTEAFAVIDVNTARYAGKRDHSDAVWKINEEAALEAARQIRLRQLSGTILIDFINGSELQEKELGQILNKAFLRDPVSTNLIDFTRLHICEITRRKIHRSLREQVHALNPA